MRKHTIKRLNGDTKTADKMTKNDYNQNNGSDATSSNDTSNLSESTIQAFQDALHFKPLSQKKGNENPMQVNLNDHDTIMTSADNQIENASRHIENNNHDCQTNENQFIDKSLFQGISLKDFDKHHKLMKEANQEKRRLLSNAIEQR